jgi:small subunit ribosomal protein S6
MAIYEITFIFPKGNKDYSKTLAKYLKDVKAEVKKKDDWGVKTLAYPIKKQSEANYLYLEAEMEPSALPKLEGKIKLDEVLLRHLIVRK